MTQPNPTYIEPIKRMMDEYDLVVIGNRHIKERVITGIIADGHIGFRSDAGQGKTLLAKTTAGMIEGATVGRIQGNPELLPSDITGIKIWDMQSREYKIRRGPIFNNIVLFDELTRSTAKAQAAILEPLEERKVTIDDQSFDLVKELVLFICLLTMNPLEHNGTFPVAEAGLNRLAYLLDMAQMSYGDELKMLREHASERNQAKLDRVKRVISIEDILTLRKQAEHLLGEADEKVLEYALRLERASRPGGEFEKEEPWMKYSAKALIDLEHRRYFNEIHGEDAHRLRESVIYRGATPRCGFWMLRTSASLAVIRGDKFLKPEHIRAVAPDVLRHNILLKDEAKNLLHITEDQVTAAILQRVPVT